jgi:HK97 family phage portal protein
MAATLVMYRSIAGNAYIEKVRSGAGKIVELWLPRPDRVLVVPDRQRFVAGYDYVIGAETFRWPAADIAHVKGRNPLASDAADFYGMPPLAALAGRVDLDNWTRQFTASFFQNAGVPVGLLSITKAVTEQERKMIQDRFAQMHGGPKNWHRLMVLDGGQATYTPMAVPLGESGAGLSDLDEINEARICMAFGVPPSLVATRLGMNSSSYANRQSDKENFWELTLVPLLREIAADLTLGFRGEYPDVDHLAFDTASVRALQEDEDKLATRVIALAGAGLMTQEEARLKLGLPEKPEEAEPVYLLASNVVPTPADQLTAPALPEPSEEDQAEADGSDYAELAPVAGRDGNGKPTNGRVPVNGRA